MVSVVRSMLTTKQPGSGANAAEVASSVRSVLIVKVVVVVVFGVMTFFVVVVSIVVVCGIVVSGIRTVHSFIHSFF